MFRSKSQAKFLIFFAVVFCLASLGVVGEARAHTTINSDKTLNIDGNKVFPTLMYYICNPGYEPLVETCAVSAGRVGNNYTINYLTGTSTYYTNNLLSSMNINNILFTKEAWNSINTTIGANPLFVGYLGADEPPISSVNWENHKSWYNARHNSDSAHPVFLNIASGSDQLSFTTSLPFIDILMLSPYPKDTHWLYPPIGSGDKCLPSSCGYGEDIWYSMQWNIWNSNMKRVDKTWDKPIYLITHATGLSQDEAGKLRLSEQEARVNSWIGITMNFNGVGFWSYKGSSQPGLNAGLSADENTLQYYNKIAGEIRGLNSVLVLPTLDYQWYYHKGNFVSFDKQSLPRGDIYKDSPIKGVGGNFNYILKKDNNIHYLVIANVDSDNMTDVTVSVPSLSGGYTAKMLGTQTTGSSSEHKTAPLVVTGGKFIDSFDGFAVHIYQLCPVGVTCPFFTGSTPVSDSQPPAITIACPPTGQTYSSSTISLSGTASDNVGISKVEVKVGSAGTYQLATGTTSWSISGITIVAGLNTVYAKVTDTASPPNTKEVFIQVTYDSTVPPPSSFPPSCTAPASTPEPCGNSIKDPGEFCEKTTNEGCALNTQKCNSDCTACDTVEVCDINKGKPCTSLPNYCKKTTPGGVIQCNGFCSVNPPALDPGVLDSCQTLPNACNQTSTGRKGCNLECDAIIPPMPYNFGGTCFSQSNICDQAGSGTVGCNGCSAIVPDLPAGLDDNNPCTIDTCDSSGAIYHSNSCGGLIPCGRAGDNPATTDIDESKPCSICALFYMLKNIINFIMTLAIGIGVFILVIAGLLYASSAGNPAKISLSKSAVTSTIIGLSIIFIAWMVVAITLQGLGYANMATWNQVNCVL